MENKLIADGWGDTRICWTQVLKKTALEAARNDWNDRPDLDVARYEVWQVSDVVNTAQPYSDQDLKTYLNTLTACQVRGAHDTGEAQHQR